MNTLEAYRAAIGTFYGKARNTRNAPTSDDYETFMRIGGLLSFETFLQTFFVVAVIIIMELNLNMSFLKLMLLLCDGDIESNPGPTFSIVKSVLGNFHQGNSKYGESAGTQCVANALYSIVWSTLHKVSLWTNWDLDYILDNGDILYKSLNVSGAIAFDQLPETIFIEGIRLCITFLENKNGALTPSLNKFLKFSENQNGMMFMIGGFTTSIIWNKPHFYLFDSHSRNSDGSFIADGHSVLLKFRTINDLEGFIKHSYLYKQNLTCSHYEIQTVKVAVSESQSTLIASSIRKRKKREKYQNSKEQITLKLREQYAHDHKNMKCKRRKWNEEYYAVEQDNIKLKKKTVLPQYTDE